MIAFWILVTSLFFYIPPQQPAQMHSASIPSPRNLYSTNGHQHPHQHQHQHHHYGPGVKVEEDGYSVSIVSHLINLKFKLILITYQSSQPTIINPPRPQRQHQRQRQQTHLILSRLSHRQLGWTGAAAGIIPRPNARRYNIVELQKKLFSSLIHHPPVVV